MKQQIPFQIDFLKTKNNTYCYFRKHTKDIALEKRTNGSVTTLAN